MNIPQVIGLLNGGIETSSTQLNGFAKSLATVSQASGTSVVALASFLGQLTIIAGVLIGAGVAIDAFTTSYQEASEAVSDSVTGYNKTQSEIDALSSRLSYTRDRIAEIQNMDSISVVEEEELGTLQEQNTLLEAQLRIRERLAEFQATSAAQAASDALHNKGFNQGFVLYNNGEGFENKWWRSLLDVGNTSVRHVDILEYIADRQERLNSLNEEFVKLQGEWKTPEVDDRIVEIDEERASLMGEIADRWSEVESYKEALLLRGDSLTPVQAEDLRAIESLEESLMSISGIEPPKTPEAVTDGLTEAKHKIIDAETVAQSAQKTFASLFTSFDSNRNPTDSAFSKYIDDYITKIGKLQDALKKLKAGDLTGSELFDLFKEFPQLAAHTDDLDTAINNLMNDMDAGILKEFNKQADGLSDVDTTALWNAYDAIMAIRDASQSAASFVEDLSTRLNNVASAMSESNSATGLTPGAVDNIVATFKDLSSYDPFTLFERTATGIHLNARALAELNAEQASGEREWWKTQVQDLSVTYNDLSRSIEMAQRRGQDTSGMEAQLDSLSNLITVAKNYATYYDGLTNAFARWETAQKTANDSDLYESVAAQIKRSDSKNDSYIDKVISSGRIRDDERAFADLFTNQDMMNASYDTVYGWFQNFRSAIIDGTSFTLADFFKYDDNGELSYEGIDNFFAAAKEKFGKSVFGDDGTIDFGRGWDDWYADQMNMSTEMFQAILKAANEFGYEFSLDSIWDQWDMVTSKVYQANDALIQLGKTDFEFDLDTDSVGQLKAQIRIAEDILSEFTGEDGTVDLSVEGAEEAQTILTALLTQKARVEGPAILSVDTSSLEGDTATAIELLQRFLEDSNMIAMSLDKPELGIDTTSFEADRQRILSELDELDLKEIEAAIGFSLDDASESDIMAAIAKLGNPEIMAKLGLDPDSEVDILSEINKKFGAFLTHIGVDLDDGDARQDLDKLEADANSTTAEIPISADTEEADAAVEETVENANNSTGEIKVGADTSAADFAIADLKTKAQNTTIKATITGGAEYSDYASNKSVTVSANVTGTDQINNLNSAANSVSDKVAKIAAKVSGTDQVLRLVNAIRSVASKTVVVTAKTLGTAMVQNLHSAISNLRDKTVTVTTNYVTTGSSGGSTRAGDRIGYVSVNGTAHASGTANASGNWGTKQKQRALVGELGPELLVDSASGTWRTIGDRGAEFVDVPKGAIIFNHKQTEDLLKNGWVIGRGKALASGTAMSSGSGSFRRSSGSTGSSGSSGQSSTYIETVNNYYSGVSSTGTVSDVAASSAFEDMYKYHQHMLNMEKEAVEDYLAWLDSAYQQAYANGEIELDDFYKYEEEIYEKRKGLAEDWFNDRQHQIDLLSKRTDSSYMRYDIDAAYEQLEIQKQMRAEAERLAAEARAYGLDNDNEYLQSLQDKWWEADEAIAQIYNDMFDQIETRYGHHIDEIEDKQKLIETQIELMQTNGERISAEYYDELIALEEGHQKELEAELAHLESALAEAVDSKAFLEYSNDWYEAKDAIRDVNQELADSALAVAKYRKEMLSLFNDIESGYNNAFGAIDHAQNMLSADMTMLQYMAHTTTGELTEQLVAYERARQTITEDLLHEYQNELKKLIADNKIEVGDSSYYEWMEKIWSAQESLMNSGNKINQYQQQEFQNISDEYSRQLGRITNQATDLQNQISTVETRGYVAGASFYNALIDNEQKQIEMLERQRDAMQNYLTKLIAEGQIQVGSAQWYEMQSAIDSVTNSINSGALAIEQYQKKLRDLKNEQFDYSMDLVDDLNSEAEFLIKLAEYTNDSVKNWDRAYRDANGQIGSMDIPGVGDLTDEGWTVMGLHAQEYATYMDMARRYAEERAKIESQLAEDPYNKELMERYRSIINLQRQSIENKYKERDAIKSLVEDGIKAELDGLKELISYYEESLDSAKDLHDYQKKIQDQTKTISNLEKQLSAYEGDDSEETRKTIQKLKNDLINAQEDLEETQYDQYISDQKKLLDKLYDDYEMTLNKRLDDVDGLVSQVIDNVVAKGNDIQDTMTSIASDANYAITDGTNSIWTEISNASGDITSGLSVLTTSITSETDRIYNLVESIYNAMTAQIKDNNSRDILAEMQANSEAWWEADEETQKRLHDRNSLLAQEYYEQTGNKLSWDSDSGYWIDSAGNHSYPVLGGNKTLDSNLIQMKANSKSWTAETGAGLEAENKRIAQNVSKQIGQPVYIDDDGVWRYGSQGKALYDYNNANALGEGTKNYAAARSLVVQMKENSKNWTEGDPNNLALENVRLAAKIGQYTDTPVFRDDASGVWYFGDKKTKLYDYFGVYHQGGIVGASTAKNEVWAKLLKNEFVLTEDQMRSVMQYNAATNAILSNGLKNINANSGVSSTHNATFNISLPSVTNYEEFANALVKDKRFEGYIQSVTVDPLAGKSKIHKNKYSW